MLTLYHAPQSRSSRIVTLIDELQAGAAVDIVPVTIPRIDGTGGPDPRNPHPDKKVPLLVHDTVAIWETIAITQYLTDLFAKAGLAPTIEETNRGAYLAWLAYYAAVVEPVFVMQVANLSHPVLTATFRGVDEIASRLETALERSPYLLGETYSAADLILASPFAWFPEATPDVAVIKDWVARCQNRPSIERTLARDTEWLDRQQAA